LARWWSVLAGKVDVQNRRRFDGFGF
jgi:hypothetical protein